MNSTDKTMLQFIDAKINCENQWKTDSDNFDLAKALKSSLSLKTYSLSQTFFSFIAVIKYTVLAGTLSLKQVICLNNTKASTIFFSNKQKALAHAVLCRTIFLATFNIKIGCLSTPA